MENKWVLIVSDIDAGGGTTIDLYFNYAKQEVKEEKIFDDGKIITNIVEIGDFDEEIYGEDGEEFMSLIF